MLVDMFILCFLWFLVLYLLFFFFKQKTAYDMRISDWSSDVCSSDLRGGDIVGVRDAHLQADPRIGGVETGEADGEPIAAHRLARRDPQAAVRERSEEHTSELQSLMRISYAVFCLKKKNARLSMTKYTQHKIAVATNDER